MMRGRPTRTTSDSLPKIRKMRRSGKKKRICRRPSDALSELRRERRMSKKDRAYRFKGRSSKIPWALEDMPANRYRRDRRRPGSLSKNGRKSIVLVRKPVATFVARKIQGRRAETSFPIISLRLL